MQLTVVLFLCVTSFVYVSGKQHDESIVLDIPEHETWGCDKEGMKTVHHLYMNVKCHKPREKLVTLKSTMGNVEITPSQVYLNRCDCDVKCGDGDQCLPLKQSMKKQLISLSFRGSSRKKCFEVNLPEHVDCQCGCNKTMADCNDNLQRFHRDSCSCKCRDERKQEVDCKKKNRKWNKETCMCECSQKMRRCSSGFTWSMDYCDCVKVQMKMALDGTIIGPEIQDNNV